eukprot:TRINITY_DN25882_c0_g1_i1.p1 TRINITY_DN25882_c0_g1~~TRINITY_DN25882_c0_g1_i1.p1  ORF type:complete len:335 (-),score=40.70 TRINITY_DN25882_c0_g1_i1:225-1163(-)
MEPRPTVGGHSRDRESQLANRILQDALRDVPLPAPWKRRKTECGDIYYTNDATDESAWEHPLAPQLKELTPVVLCCLVLAPQARSEACAALSRRWQFEAEVEYKKWYVVEDSNGDHYYCKKGESESMWEHPKEVVLPPHFLKIKTAQLLLNETYLAGIGFHSGACCGTPKQQLKGALLAGRCKLLICFTLMRNALACFVHTVADLLCCCHQFCFGRSSASARGGAARMPRHPANWQRGGKTAAADMTEILIESGSPKTESFYIGGDDEQEAVGPPEFDALDWSLPEPVKEIDSWAEEGCSGGCRRVRDNPQG